jgi:hypothetical protein
MFEDLTYEAQMRLLAEAGVESASEMSWNIRPVAVVDLEKEGHHLQKNVKDKLYDTDDEHP